MKVNKFLSEISLKKIWNKLTKHDENIDTLTSDVSSLNSNLTQYKKANTFYASYTKTYVSAGKTTIDVKFSDYNYNTEFGNSPVIVATIESDWTDSLKLTIDNVSTTGFSFIVHNSIETGTQVTVHWIAMGYIA